MVLIIDYTGKTKMHNRYLKEKHLSTTFNVVFKKKSFYNIMSLNPPTYQELNQLSFYELRKRAKSIEGLKGKYLKLKRHELK